MSAKLEQQQLVLDELERELGREFDEEYIKQVAKEHGYRDPSEKVFYSGD